MFKVSSVTSLHTKSIFVRILLLAILTLAETHRLRLLQYIHLHGQIVLVFFWRGFWSGLAQAVEGAVVFLASSSSSQVIRKLKRVVGDLNSQSSAWGDVNAHVQPVRSVLWPTGQDVLESRKILQRPLLKLSYPTVNNQKKEVESLASHQSDKQFSTVSMMTLNWLIQAFSFFFFSYHCFSSVNLSISS